MDNAIKWMQNHFVEIIIGIAIVFIIVGAIGSAIADRGVWNDGYCVCGGRWQYVDSVTRLSSSEYGANTRTSYIYRCDRCGKMHEFSGVR